MIRFAKPIAFVLCAAIGLVVPPSSFWVYTAVTVGAKVAVLPFSAPKGLLMRLKSVPRRQGAEMRR